MTPVRRRDPRERDTGIGDLLSGLGDLAALAEAPWLLLLLAVVAVVLLPWLAWEAYRRYRAGTPGRDVEWIPWWRP